MVQSYLCNLFGKFCRSKLASPEIAHMCQKVNVMKRLSVFAILLFTVFSFVPCYAHHLAVVVAKDNNVDSVTASNLAKMFKIETRKWPDGKNVVLVLHRQSLSQMETLEKLNKMSQMELKALIAAHKDSIFLADSDADLLNLVQTTPGAIGLVDVRSINDKIKVLKVDGKLPLENGYLPHH
jgi:ABC-type phosphate transport system substrate-binding protein